MTREEQGEGGKRLGEGLSLSCPCWAQSRQSPLEKLREARLSVVQPGDRELGEVPYQGHPSLAEGFSQGITSMGTLLRQEDPTCKGAVHGNLCDLRVAEGMV